jgi:formylglycine-generating enzyme required for sulfatase activity
MAGLCLTDAGKEGVAGEVWAQAVKSLLELISRPGAPLEHRVEAGNVLGDLGDPRIKDLPTLEDMAEIPAGEFLMGTSREQVEALAARYEWAKEWKAKGWFDDELTGEPVFVDAFWIDRYPVTNLQFARFAAETGYRTTAEKHKGAETWRTFARPGRQNHPVVNVSWHDAVAYCRWRREKTGLAVSLPSEAQWEKAARGRDRRVWPWGNDWDASRANTWEGEVRETTAVGIYPTEGGPIKCYDMAGNVWEWTSSLYKPYPYRPDDGREDPIAEGPRVLRGGSWDLTAVYARSAYRLYDPPDSRYAFLGFRCVVVPPGSPPK